MSETIQHATSDTFEDQVIKSEVPVLVDYWAEWCGPCKNIAPMLDEIAIDYSGKLNIVKVDVDKNYEIAEKYAIRGIPTLMIFNAGEVIATKSGANSKAELSTFIDEAI